MPKFFFDTVEGRLNARDWEGMHFESQERAQAEAARTMGEMCRDYMPALGTQVGTMIMTVLDADRSPLYRLTVNYRSKSFT